MLGLNIDQPSSSPQHKPNQPSSSLQHKPNQPSSSPQHKPNQPSSSLQHLPNQPSPSLQHLPNQPSPSLQHSSLQPLPSQPSSSLDHLPNQPSSSFQQHLPNQPLPSLQQHLTNQPSPSLQKHLPNQPSSSLDHLPNQPSSSFQQHLLNQPSPSLQQHLPNQQSPSLQQHLPNQPSSSLQHVPNQPSSSLQHVPNQPSSSLQHVPSQPSSSLQHVPSQPSSSLQHVPSQPSNLQLSNQNKYFESNELPSEFFNQSPSAWSWPIQERSNVDSTHKDQQMQFDPDSSALMRDAMSYSMMLTDLGCTPSKKPLLMRSVKMLLGLQTDDHIPLQPRSLFNSAMPAVYEANLHAIHQSFSPSKQAVKHSQRMNATALKPWFIADSTGIVEAAHCDCMAGLGEACSHVGALLFFTEAASRIACSKTVTQEKAYWMLPSSIDRVPYSEIGDIDFTSTETKKRQLQSSISGLHVPKRTPLKLQHVAEPTAAEMDGFKAILFASKAKSSILSVSAKYQKHFLPNIMKDGLLPEPLINYRDEKYMSMSSEELKRECACIFENIIVTEEQANNTEAATRQQSRCKEWHTLRLGRITASNMKAVCTSSIDKPAATTLRNICGESSKFSSKATTWGCQHEQVALKSYEAVMRHTHENFRVTECGLFIHPKYPHIGATPDALVNCSCCGEGLVEVKCPYCAKDKLINDSNIEYLINSHLKQGHKYYYQIQTQLLVTEKDYCDFVVWTAQDLSIERVTENDEVIKEIVDKSKMYFVQVVLPELMGKLISRDNCITVLRPSTSQAGATADAPELICICQVPYNEQTDNVVGCDNENCHYKWLHFECVKIKKAPKGRYFCPDCKESKRSRKKQKLV